MQKVIYEYLKKSGLSQNSKGFKYVMRAIEIRIKERNNKDLGVCQLYYRIAKEYGDTKSNVERSIRHCIATGGKKIKNSKFIETAANEIAINSDKAEPLANDINELIAQLMSDVQRINEAFEEIVSIKAKVDKINEFLGV